MNSKIIIKINYLSEQIEIELPKTLEELNNFIINNLKIEENFKKGIEISYEDESKDKINLLSEDDYILFVSNLKENIIKNEITINELTLNENEFEYKFNIMKEVLTGRKTLNYTSNNLLEMSINSDSSISYSQIKDRKTKEKENEEKLKKEYEKKINDKEEEYKTQLKLYEKDNNIKLEKLNSEIIILKNKLKEENYYQKKMIEQEKEFKSQLDLKEKENILKNKEIVSLKEEKEKLKNDYENKIKEKEKIENEYINKIKEKEKLESEYINKIKEKEKEFITSLEFKQKQNNIKSLALKNLSEKKKKIEELLNNYKLKDTQNTLKINELNSEIISMKKEKENLNEKINEIEKKIKEQETTFKIQFQGKELKNDKNLEIIIKEAEKLKKENFELKEKNNSDIKAIMEEKQNLEKKCEKFEKENLELISKINELKSYEIIIKIKEEDYKTQINNFYINLKKLNEEYKKKEIEHKNIIEEKDKSLSRMSKEIDDYRNRNKELIKKLSEFKNKK